MYIVPLRDWTTAEPAKAIFAHKIVIVIKSLPVVVDRAGKEIYGSSKPLANTT